MLVARSGISDLLRCSHKCHPAEVGTESLIDESLSFKCRPGRLHTDDAFVVSEGS